MKIRRSSRQYARQSCRCRTDCVKDQWSSTVSRCPLFIHRLERSRDRGHGGGVESGIQRYGRIEAEAEGFFEVEGISDALVDRSVRAFLGQWNSAITGDRVVNKVVVNLLEGRVKPKGDRGLINVELSQMEGPKVGAIGIDVERVERLGISSLIKPSDVRSETYSVLSLPD